MNAYRFGTGQEPTDEMLEQIMKLHKKLVKAVRKRQMLNLNKCVVTFNS